MYGHQQECARQAEARCETQDLEKRLAELYSCLDGGEDCADLTAPRARALLTSGEMKRPALLLGAPSAAAGLLAAPQGAQDVAALALRAFAGDAAVQAPAGALATRPAARAPPVYARAIGVDPACRPRRLGPTEAAEAAGLAITPAAFRDLTLPD